MSDTYVMMDNMREYLGTFPSPRTHAHFLGRRYITEDAKSFYGGTLLFYLLRAALCSLFSTVGGSGTMLSQHALRVLGKAVDADDADNIFPPHDTFADDGLFQIVQTSGLYFYVFDKS